MKKALILFPNQLFKNLPSGEYGLIVLVEDDCFFSDFNFHKKKLVFHRASLKYYQQMLERRKYRVAYLENREFSKKLTLGNWLSKRNIKMALFYGPAHFALKKRLQKDLENYSISAEFIENPLFLYSEYALKTFFKNKKHFSMNSFYISQRKKMNILVNNGIPEGEKWSFDKENRRKYTGNIAIPNLNIPSNTKLVIEAQEYVNENYPQNPGSSVGFFYPITHAEAEKWFDEFLNNRLDNFGTYEDAIDSNEILLFHSLLSPLLNSGLLCVKDVVLKTVQFANSHQVAINNLEGFVRQIIGWREFMHAVYTIKGKQEIASNLWGFQNRMPKKLYNASTGIEPVDQTIRKLMDNAYVHHIERLMILGNFMLLCEIDPNEVYKWFMELFIDSYEWVMVPNVYGMSQYADGGLITTKPYISSSNYILKMSNYKKGSWCNVWDSLFWRFVIIHKDELRKNLRMRVIVNYADKMGDHKLREHTITAENFLKELYQQ